MIPVGNLTVAPFLAEYYPGEPINFWQISGHHKFLFSAASESDHVYQINSCFLRAHLESYVNFQKEISRISSSARCITAEKNPVYGVHVNHIIAGKPRHPWGCAQPHSFYMLTIGRLSLIRDHTERIFTEN